MPAARRIPVTPFIHPAVPSLLNLQYFSVFTPRDVLVLDVGTAIGMRSIALSHIASTHK